MTLVALLTFAPLASASKDPVARGTTTVTFSRGLAKQLKQAGVNLAKTGPAKLRGSKATFPVSGGSVDPVSGAGTLTHSGGLEAVAGGKRVSISGLVFDTATKSVTARVAGRRMKAFKLRGVSFARNGFGVDLSARSLKLTATAAAALDRKLSSTPAAGSRAGESEAIAAPFRADVDFGSSESEEQPRTVALVPGGAVTFALDAELAKKLGDVRAELAPLAGTSVLSAAPPVFSFPVLGGSFGPTGKAGVVSSAGGVLLRQGLPKGKDGKEAFETVVSLSEFKCDLAARTVTVAVTATSTASQTLNFGPLRSAAAKVTIGGVTADPTTRSVGVQNGSAVLEPLSGEVLDGFVKAYAAYVAEAKKLEGKEEEGTAIAAKVLAEDAIAGGDPLGLISFSGQAR